MRRGVLPSLVQRISLAALLGIIKHVEFAIFIWNLLIMSSWSRPSKVRQHVVLSPDPFFARAHLGSGNETSVDMVAVSLFVIGSITS